MRINTTPNKLSLRSLAIVFFVVLVGMSMPLHVVRAGLLEFGYDTVQAIANAIPYGILFIVQAVLVMLLTIVAFILNNVFSYNLILNPTNIGAVIDAWTKVRDIANSLFLLVILWIAIKTIFSFDSDKRLLPRVIIIAFLMNFSLALTGAAFGLANVLAKPFQKAIDNDVVGFIVANLHLQNVTNATDESKNLEAAFKKDGGKNCGFSTLLSSNIPLESPLRLGCPGGEIAIGVSQALAWGAGTLFDIYRPTINLFISNIFLLLITVLLWFAAFLLIARIIAMVFLGVLAPAAFFLHIVPIPAADAMFNRWLKNLIGWAFVAPVFYFLFYLSLLVLGAMAKAPAAQVGGSLASNLFAMIPLLVFAVFLSATLKISKSMAGEFAQMAINAGKAVGGVAIAVGAAAATGGASLAMNAAAPTIQKTMGALSERPLLRRSIAAGTGGLSTLATKGARNFYQQQNEEIDDLKKNYQGQSPRDLTQQLKETFSTKKKVAIAETLHEQGKYDNLDEDTQKKVKEYAKRYGRQEGALKANPSLVVQKDVEGATDDQDARRRIIKGMKSEEKARMAKNAWNDPEIQTHILENSNTEDIKQIMRHNEQMYEALLGFFNTHHETMTNMRDDTKRFLQATMMRAKRAGVGETTDRTTGGADIAGEGAPTGGPGTT